MVSYTGSFEREVLKNFDSIVERSLPIEKVQNYYKNCSGAGKQVILNYVTFFEERRKVSANCCFFFRHVISKKFLSSANLIPVQFYLETVVMMLSPTLCVVFVIITKIF